MIAYIIIKKNFKIIILLVLVIISFLNIKFLIFVDNNKNLEVNFLDIGQGDSAYIKFPNHNNLLIDTGPNKFVSNQIDRVSDIFDKSIKNILLTHPDKDHIGGAEEVLKRYSIDNVFLAKNQEYKIDFVQKIYNIAHGDQISFGAILVKNLNPYNISENMETNHNSIVSLINYNKISFLFMADADKEIERKLLASGEIDNLKNQILVLKVGHHGSKTSSSEAFLKKLHPEYCIVSVGKDNSYGHPAPEIMLILNKYCDVIYRTDIDGNIKFDTDGESLELSTS